MSDGAELHKLEIVSDDENDEEAKVVAWTPPPPSNGATRHNAILALQAAAVAAQEFNAHFDVRDEERESSVPLLLGEELVIGKAPLRSWGRFFNEFELKAVKLLVDDEEEIDPEDSNEKERSKLMKRSIDGHYSVKLLQPGIMDSDLGTQAAEDFMLETRLLMNLAVHPNISQIYGLNRGGIDTLLDSGRDGFFIITDRIQSTLLDRLAAWKAKKGYRQPSVTGQTIRRFAQRIEVAIDIASALRYLHDKRLVYHIRPEKIGFDAKQGTLKLLDFGQTRQEGSVQAQARSMIQSGDMDVLRYIAPEVLCQAPATTSSDVYSFSLVLWEIMSLKTPYGSWDRATHFERCVQSHNRPPMNRQWPQLGQDLLQNTWHPHVRWTMRKVHSKLVDLLMIEETSATGTSNSSHQDSLNGSSHHERSSVRSRSRRHKDESSNSHRRHRDEYSSVRKSRTKGGDSESSPDRRGSRSSSPTKPSSSSAAVVAASVAAANVLEEVIPEPQDKDEDEHHSEDTATTTQSTSSSADKDEDKNEDEGTAAIQLMEDGSVVMVDGDLNVVPRSSRKRRENSPRKHRATSPRRHRGDNANQRSARRSSLSNSNPSDDDTIQPTRSPRQRSRYMHRSASMSHVLPDAAAPVMPPAPLELTQPKNDDYDDDFENDDDERDERKSKGLYGYVSNLVRPKKSGNEEDDRSTRSSRSVNESPLRKRLGGVASVLLGGALRRPSGNGASVGAPADEPVTSPCSPVERPGPTVADSSPSPAFPRRSATKDIESMTTPHREPREQVRGESPAQSVRKESRSGPRTPSRSMRESEPSAKSSRRENKESGSSRRDNADDCVSVSSRRSERSGRSVKQKSSGGSGSDDASASSSRKHKSSSSRRASMGRLKSSRIITSSRHSTIEGSKDDASLQKVIEHEGDGKQIGEEIVNEESNAAMAELRRRRALAGSNGSTHKRMVPNEEASVDLLEAPGTPGRLSRIRRPETVESPKQQQQQDSDNAMAPTTPGRLRQRRRCSTGGATPITGVQCDLLSAPIDGSEHSKTPSTPGRIRSRRRGSTGGAIPLMGSLNDLPGNDMSRMQSSRNLSSTLRSGKEYSSSHTRLSADETWTQDLVKPLDGASPDFSASTTATSCSSTIDSSRIDRLINMEEEGENDDLKDAPMEPVTPRRRLARLKSVTQLFRKNINGDAAKTSPKAPPEAPPESPAPSSKRMSRFMKADGGATDPAPEPQNQGIQSRRGRRASVS